MIDESTSSRENAPEQHPTHEPMIATVEQSPPSEVPAEPSPIPGHVEVSETANTDATGSESLSDIKSEEAKPMITTKETERELEPETPKPAKKPRKSSKVATSEESAPAEESKPAAVNVGSGEGAAEHSKKWYVVKVQSGREDSIKAAIERKVKIEGLEEFFGQIAIPVEEIVQKKSVRVTDKKTGDKVTQEKKVIKHQKKFPGYIFAEVDYNDRILYLFRETSGVGDFVGASQHREPTPMTDREVRAMLTGVAEPGHGNPNQKQKVKLDYEKGDKVKIRDGAFANMEGIVKSITEVKDTGETPKVKVEVTIFGRPVEVDLDYWHVDKA
jgi:transcriptional antiterminator NusG